MRRGCEFSFSFVLLFLSSLLLPLLLTDKFFSRPSIQSQDVGGCDGEAYGTVLRLGGEGDGLVKRVATRRFSFSLGLLRVLRRALV